MVAHEDDSTNTCADDGNQSDRLGILCGLIHQNRIEAHLLQNPIGGSHIGGAHDAAVREKFFLEIP